MKRVTRGTRGRIDKKKAKVRPTESISKRSIWEGDVEEQKKEKRVRSSPKDLVKGSRGGKGGPKTKVLSPGKS